VIAAPAINQPRGLNAIDRILVATKVAVRDVKTRRYQILGFVNS
jgi:hypothetical protein